MPGIPHVRLGYTSSLVDAQRAEALLRTDALQSAIFNSANFSSIATDAKGVIQIFNVGAERMLGYKADDVVNNVTPADMSDPAELVARAAALSVEFGTSITPGFEALVFKAARGIEDIYELTYVRRDLSRFPAVVSVTALRDAEEAIIGYLLIGTDNTARKQAEDALLQAGALERAIFSSPMFSCIATDAQGVIQIFNVGAERMLGYTAAEVVNAISAADLHDCEEVILRAAALSLEFNTLIAPGFEALVFKAARGIEDIYELTKVRKDGTRFPAVVSVTALRDPENAIIGYLIIGTDNTARQEVEEERKKRKRSELALQQSEIQRERDTAHAKELAVVNQELEAFSHSVSHDLRAPLRHIHGYVEMLRVATEGQLSGKAKRYLTTIAEASVEMGELIDDLLAFSRVGHAEIGGTTIDLNGLVRDVIRGLEMAIGDRPITWQIAPLPSVAGDASLIKQVLTNLIDNAIKYSRTRDPARIEIGCAGEETGRAVLFVRDNGVGFDMRYVDKLFGVFQRLHRAEEFEGTGIGLATVRRIIGRHGGRVWAEGASNHGATFYFTLALTSVDHPAGAAAI